MALSILICMTRNTYITVVLIYLFAYTQIIDNKPGDLFCLVGFDTMSISHRGAFSLSMDGIVSRGNK